MQSSVAPPTDSASHSSPDAQARLLDAILNTSGDLIFVVAPDGKYLYVSASAARGLGLPREQIIGRTAEMVGFAAQAVWIEQQRARVIATGEHLVGDFQYPDPNDGLERHYQYRYSPLLCGGRHGGGGHLHRRGTSPSSGARRRRRPPPPPG